MMVLLNLQKVFVYHIAHTYYPHLPHRLDYDTQFRP